MIKGTGVMNGRPTVFLGLSFRNLEKFRDAPGDTFIPIKGEELGIPFDILIFSGETEDAMAEYIKDVRRNPQ